MAKQSNKAKTEQQPAKKKRRIKNPETFRERAQKAAEAGNQPKSAAKLKQAGGKATGPVRRQMSKGYNSETFVPFRKILNVIGRVIFPKYFRQSWQELKLVTWPNWNEGRRLTVAVLIFAIVFGVAIAGVDWALDKVFHQLLLT